jgi:hypothetical protein
MGYAACKAWIYRASGNYQTAALPPAHNVPYGAAYGQGDIITAIRHSDTQIEFLLNGESQGVIELPRPGNVVGCADVCNLPVGGGSSSLRLSVG